MTPFFLSFFAELRLRPPYSGGFGRLFRRICRILFLKLQKNLKMHLRFPLKSGTMQEYETHGVGDSGSFRI